MWKPNTFINSRICDTIFPVNRYCAVLLNNSDVARSILERCSTKSFTKWYIQDQQWKKYLNSIDNSLVHCKVLVTIYEHTLLVFLKIYSFLYARLKNRTYYGMAQSVCPSICKLFPIITYNSYIFLSDFDQTWYI